MIDVKKPLIGSNLSWKFPGALLLVYEVGTSIVTDWHDGGNEDMKILGGHSSLELYVIPVASSLDTTEVDKITVYEKFVRTRNPKYNMLFLGFRVRAC